MRYILHYTEPGDLVFDGFCGTGMTGIAAQLCDDPSTLAALGYTSNTHGVTGVKHLSGLATIVSPVLLMVFVPLR